MIKYLLILMLYYRAAAADTRLRAQITASAGGMREQQRNIIFLRVAKAYCAWYIFLSNCTTLLLREYNGFRGSICVTGMNFSSKTFRYSCKHGRYSALTGSVYSVDCVKRNQTSVFQISLIQSKHMLKRGCVYSCSRYPFDVTMRTLICI